MIALIDRLAAYAAREAENESPEERQKQEEEAAKRLAGLVKKQRAKTNGSAEVEQGEETEGWGAIVALKIEDDAPVDDGKIDGVVPTIPERLVRKFRGIPEDVKLFEVFWHQVVELIKVSFSFSIHPQR